MRILLALYPFSKTSKLDEEGSYEWDDINKCKKPVNWHIVLFDKWYDTGISIDSLDSKFETSICFCDGVKWGDYQEIIFTRYWGNNLIKKDLNNKSYAYNFIKLPWCHDVFKHMVLVNNEWVEVPNSDLDRYEAYLDLLKYADTRTYSFNANGETVKAKCHAESYKASVYWFPTWLKELFYKEDKFIEIEFSSPIGQNYNGISRLSAEWGCSIRDSWYHFKHTRLKEILK